MADMLSADEAFPVSAEEAFGPDPETTKPLPPSKGLLDRMYDSALLYEKFKGDVQASINAGVKEGFGDASLGLSDEHTQQMRDLGLFNDPAKGQWSPIRTLNEAIVRPIALVGDVVARGVNAGVYGVGGAVGTVVEKATGDKTEGEQARREAINFQNYLLLTAGGVNPITRVERVPGAAAVDAPIGGLPALRDFDNAATVLRNEKSAPVLRQLYDERGIHPAEVLHDAQTDVTIIQDLAAGEVPRSYGGPKALPAPLEGGGAKRPAPEPEWFAGSKVTDETGQPLVVYHGTLGDFEEFSPAKLGEATGAPSAREGFFFAKDPEVASSYSVGYNPYTEGQGILGSTVRFLDKITGGLYGRANEALVNRLGLSAIDAGENVRPVYLDIKNPYVHDFKGSEFRETSYADILKQAKAGGHDGVILKNTIDPGFAGDGGASKVTDIYVAFRPDQIRSVFDGRTPKSMSAPEAGSVPPNAEVPSGGKPPLAPLEDGGAGGGRPPEPPKPPGGELPNDRGGQKALPSPDEPMTVRQAQDAMLERINVGEHDPKKPVTFQSLYTKFIDDLNPVHEAVKQALKDTHPTNAGAPPVVDPYQLFRLTRGVAGKADQMLLHGTFNALSFKTNGVSLSDVLKPLQEKVPAGELDLMDQFRAYTTAKRTIELSGRGIETGMPLEAAKKIVGDAAQIERFEPIHRAAVEYQNRLALYLKDAGLTSPEAYKAMLEANKNYTPFYRYVGGEVLPEGRVGRALASRNPIKKIKGSDAEIIDPVESMIKNTYTYIALAEKNMAGVALVDLLKKADEGGIWRVDMLPNEPKPKTAVGPGARRIEGPGVPKLEGGQRAIEGSQAAIEGDVIPPQSVAERAWQEVGPVRPKKEPPHLLETDIIDAEFTELRETLAKEGADPDLAVVIHGLARAPEGDTITVFRNGVRESYLVSDPDLLAAWRGLDTQTISTLTKILALPARSLRAGATLVPEFAIGNLVRDFQTAFVNTKGALFSPLDTARGVAALIKKGESYQDWLKGGGANSAMVSLDRRYMQENLLKLGANTGLGEGAWNVVTSPIRGLRMVSEFAENATRLGEFQKAMRGVEATKENIQAAAFRSREATLDFQRIGAEMRAYNMITAFGNANIQGTDRLIRAIHDAPVSTLTRIAIGITAPSLILWAFNRSDPVYQDLPDWQKDLFYIFIKHSWRDATQAEAQSRPDYLRRTTSDGRLQIDDPTVFRLKKDFTTGILFGSGVERAAEAFFNDNPKAWKGFFQSVKDAVVPTLVPTLPAPLLEQYSNKSALTSGPIVPERLERLLPEYRYTPGTTELAKLLSRVIGAFPGMREAATDPSHPFNGLASGLTTPILIENYIRDWTGGVGSYALNILDASLRKAGALPDPVKPTATLAEIPFVKAFMVRYPSASVQSIRDFYERNAANALVVNTIRAKAAEGDLEAVNRIQELDGMAVKLDGLQKAMSAQESMIRMIYASDKLDAQQKRQNIDTLYFQIIQAAHAGNKMLDTIDALKR